MFDSFKKEKNSAKKSIISMLETIKEALETVELKSEVILVDEIIDNINDSINENHDARTYKKPCYIDIDYSTNSKDNDSIIIKNNKGQINNVSGNGSINSNQIIKQTIKYNKRSNKFYYE
ncbi:MAG: hypothetical protein PVH88_09010 [Ignavibacteria bacterium]|jgi:hypothetical protein